MFRSCGGRVNVTDAVRARRSPRRRDGVCSPECRLQSQGLEPPLGRCPSRVVAVRVPLVLVLLSGVALTGCQTVSPGERAVDDIVQITQFYANYPWRVDYDDRITGFKVAVYFVSSATERGAFVKGDILCWLYQRSRRADGRRDRELLHTWRLSEAEAQGFRFRERKQLGYGYGLVLTWPSSIDVHGREIEIVLGYERTDGRIILGPPRPMKVPVPADLRALPHAPSGTSAPAPGAGGPSPRAETRRAAGSANPAPASRPEPESDGP